MKKYLKHFAVWLIIFALVLVAYVSTMIALKPETGPYKRTNTQCKTTERVFDYAEVLTDEEENSLRNMISVKEDEIGCDIVLVTISDPDYAGDSAMMNYADDFYDENMYGYNEPWGDGALYLDNFLGVGNSYSWFSTCGRVEYRYDDYMIDSLMNAVCSRVNNNHYSAYVTYIESLSRTMTTPSHGIVIPTYAIWVISALVTLIYVLVCVNWNIGKRTTSATTYVAGGHAQFPDHRDVFLYKKTTRHKISSSSSSGGGGGGGHHFSSGGHSHGGGGGRH